MQLYKLNPQNLLGIIYYKAPKTIKNRLIKSYKTATFILYSSQTLN